jgi:deoxyribonucleoside regulator
MSKDFLLSEIAKLYYIDGMKQNEIARRFHITPMNVSRLLKRAENVGIVKIHVTMPFSIDMSLGKAIKDKYKLVECIVLNNENHGDMKKVIGQYLAGYIANLMGPGMIVGLSWGKTLSEFAQSLPYSNFQDSSVIQLSGGFLSESDYMLNPTNIVKIASQKFSCSSWFLNAPLYIGSLEAKRQLMEDTSIRYVFNLASRSDINIFGLSSLGKNNTMSRVGVLQDSDILELREKNAIGDVAGFFIDNDGNEVKWSKSGLNMGVPLSIIKKAQNVICVADEREKVEVVKAALKKQYMNILIISSEVAHAM